MRYRAIERLRLKYTANPRAVPYQVTRLTVKLFRLLFIIGLSYLFLFPVFYMLSASFQDPASAYDPSVIWIPRQLSLVSISGALKAMNFAKSALLTFTIAAGSTAAALISCSLVGYGFARFRFFTSRVGFMLVVLTIIVPPQTISLSAYLNFRFFDFGGLLRLLSPLTGVTEWNLLNKPWVFIIPSLFAAGLRSGLFILIFRQFFSGLPRDLEEAAKIDGCGALSTFLRIMVPLAVPASITVLLFSFIWHWNDLYNSSMFFTLEVRPLSVMLNGLLESLKNSGVIDATMTAYERRTYMQAGALLTILPPLIIYIFTQKYFTESIERTGIVG